MSRIRIARGCTSLLAMVALAGLIPWAAGASESDQDRIAQGRELFMREWVPGDSRSHGGDGLGPLYNETSCVACHSLGGPGGAGSMSKNVDIVTLCVEGEALPRREAGRISPRILHVPERHAPPLWDGPRVQNLAIETSGRG